MARNLAERAAAGPARWSGEDEYDIREFLQTQDARDRPPGLLTYDDQEYLLGKKDLEETGEVQLRQRMRDRISSGLLDFELLLYLVEDRDVQTIFGNLPEPPWPKGEENSDVYHGTEFALAFLYYGIAEHTHVNFERLLKEAIE